MDGRAILVRGRGIFRGYGLLHCNGLSISEVGGSLVQICG